MIETVCANCKEPFVIIVGTNDDHVCMTCGSPLCDECYDKAGSTCALCEDGQTPRSGECVECGRDCLQLNDAGVCEGCVTAAMIDQQQP